MKEKATPPSARVSVALSGKMVQFNITLLVLVFLILGVLFICSRSSTPLLLYAGTGVALLAALATITFVICFYIKQKSRPLDGQVVAITMKSEDGNEICVRNPPDAFFEQEEFRAMARSFLVGYDDNMCPDGEVIGKAAEGNYRLYTEKEKEQFMKHHREEIKGKKLRAVKLLEIDEPKDGHVFSVASESVKTISVPPAMERGQS